jgi:hypothetical protein
VVAFVAIPQIDVETFTT